MKRISGRRGPAWVAVWLLSALPAAANSLLIEIRPTADPHDYVACYVGQVGPEMRVLETTGPAMPNRPPVRWFARAQEVAALADALRTLIDDTPGPIDPDTYRLPPPPTITINWVAHFGGRTEAGLYDQRGLARPRSLDELTPLVLEGGPCAALFAG